MRHGKLQRVSFDLVQMRRSGISGGAWVAQLIERPTVDFSSGHDLTVREIELRVRLYADSVESLFEILSPSLFAPPPLTLSQNI